MFRKFTENFQNILKNYSETSKKQSKNTQKIHRKFTENSQKNLTNFSKTSHKILKKIELNYHYF